MPEAVVVDAVRTPIARRNGALRDQHPAQLLAGLFRTIVDRSVADAETVDDVFVGCMEQVGEQANTIGRGAWLAAGLPESVPATTIERQCTSSQQALHFAAQAVLAGAAERVMVGGVESMTRVPMSSSVNIGGGWSPDALTARYAAHAEVGGVEISQFESAELIARRWGIGRSEQETYAQRSHESAATARDAGHFRREIAPVSTTDGWVADDECIRGDTTLARMAALTPIIEAGTVTAATSSQIADGAAAVLVMSRQAATRAGLRPRARIVAFEATGHDVIEGLTAIVPATRRVLRNADVDLTDVDAVEINEAFAVVPLAWKRELATTDTWFDATVNTRGGAVALGHPIGCSGARMTVTLLDRLDEIGGRFGLQTICGSLGLATALILERLP